MAPLLPTVKDYASFSQKWELLHEHTENYGIFVSYDNKDVSVSPLYIHEFPLYRAKFMAHAELLNITYPDPALIPYTATKLRWYRNARGYLQKEIADYLGMNRKLYSFYENDQCEYYPQEMLEKLASFYEIHVTDLMDEYNLFLFNNDPGKQISDFRQSHNFTQRELAGLLDVNPCNLRQWEHNQVRMTRSSWKKFNLLLNSPNVVEQAEFKNK